MLYGYHLAQIHDEGFKDFSKYAYQEITEKIDVARNLIITDLGCGSGEFLHLFSKQNNELRGVDISESMIALARMKTPAAALEVGSIYDYPIQYSHVITAIGEVLNYIESMEDKTQYAALFEKIYSRLLPKGVFMFDVMLESGEMDRTYQRIFDTENWTVLSDSQEDKERKLVKRKIITFYKDGATYVKNEEIHYLRLYSEVMFEQLLNEIGFIVKIADSYSNFKLGMGRKAFFCMKE